METPDQHFFHTNTHQFTPEKRHSDVNFIIDDLLNFPTDDTDEAYDAVGDTANAGSSTNSSVITTTAVESCNSVEVACQSLTDTQFAHDLCVPYEDMAELEWLSNFVEDSFSNEDMEKLQLISGFNPRACVKPRACVTYETPKFQHDADNQTNNPIFNSDMTVQGKARTKRSRAAPSNWTSRLIGLAQPSVGSTSTISSESESDIGSSSIAKTAPPIGSSSIAKNAPPIKKEVCDSESHSGEGRRCLHCATDKTPQWRTGPLGPKTLCNACGVRYKSGRLVPEYRPASSPTFILTKHSNSHRKVLELRRQKEMQSVHQQPFFHQNMMFDVSNGEEYLIHQHIGPDYRQLI